MKAQIPLKSATPTLRRVFIPVLLLLLALILPGMLRATDYTWTQTAGGSGAAYTWTNNASWTPAPAAGDYPGATPGNYDTLDFRVAMTGAQTIVQRLGTSATVNNTISAMKIGGTSGTFAYTFSKGTLNAPKIYLMTSGGNALLQKSGDGNDIFPNANWNLYNNWDITFTGGAGNSGSLELATAINEINTGMAVNVSGPGKLILSGGINAYTGGTSVQQTTVQFNDPRRFGVGTITVGNGGTLLSSGGNTLDVLRPLLLKGGGTVKLATLTNTSVFVIQGVIANNDSSGATSLTCAGPGTIKLTGANTYTTDTHLTGGTLNLSTTSLNGSGALTVSDGTTLGMDASGGATTLSNSSLTLGTAGTVTLNLTNGTISGNPSLPAITSAGGLSAAAASVVINLTGTGYQTGTFPLISYTGTALSSIANFTLNVSGLVGYSAQLVNNTGSNPSIDVQISPLVNLLTWSGAANNQWDVASLNWKLGSVATNYQEYISFGVGDAVTFNDTLANPPLNTSINIIATVVPSSVTVSNSAFDYSIGGNPIGGAGALTKSGGGALKLSDANSYAGGTTDAGGTLRVGNNSALGTGLVTFTGGALSSDGGAAFIRTLANYLNIQADTTLGDAVNSGALTFIGQVNLANGTPKLTIPSPVTLSGKVITGGFSKDGTGTLTLLGTNTYAGGTTISSGILQVGNGGTMGTLGTGAVADNATLTFFRNDLTAFAIANNISGSSALNFNGTGVIQESSYSLTGDNSGFNGPMTLNNTRVQANTQAHLGYGTVTVNSGSEIYLNGAVDYGNTFSIAGHGWLETAATNGIGAFRFASGSSLSGTVHLLADAWLSTWAAGAVGTVSGGIDDSGHSPSGITKGGVGTIVLSGNNSYHGATVVSVGTLSVTTGSALPTSSALVVSNGATFATSSGVTVKPASANLQAGSSLSISIDPFSPVLAIDTGVLTTGGTNEVTLNITGTSPLAVGAYPLIHYSSLSGNGFGAFFLPSAPGVIQSLSNDTVAHIIYLNISVVENTLTWHGGIDNKWDTSTANWYLPIAGYDTNYQSYAGGVGDIVIFDDSLVNTSNTNINVTTVVAPGSMTVASESYNYTFSGSAISGATILTKSGAGVLKISDANSYSGGTIDAGGTVQVGNNSALGSGLVTLAGGGLSSDSGTARTLGNDLTVTANATLGDIANSGALTLTGGVNLANNTHTLNVASLVTFSGAVTNGTFIQVGNSTLTLKGAGNFGTDGNAVQILGGTLVLDGGATVLAEGFRPDCTNAGGTARMVVNNGAQLLIGGTSHMRVGYTAGVGAGTTNSEEIAGLVTFTNSNPGGFLFYRNGAHSVVTLLANGVAEVKYVGVAGSGVNDTEFDFNGGTLRALKDGAGFFTNALTAAYVRDGGAIIDSSNYNITIAQPLLAPLSGASGGLIKVGSGALTLTNTHTYTGATVVSNGTLLVDGVIDPASAVRVASGATLGGTGTVNGAVTVNAGGTVLPGDGIGSIGTLTCGNNLTLNSGAAALFELNKANAPATNDYLVVSGTVSVTAGILTVTNTGPALVLGDNFTLLSKPASGFTTLNLPDLLDTNLAWANNLAVDGSIAVVTATVVTPPPAITSVVPSSGRTNGGTLVAITGSDFVSGMTVQFGANASAVANFTNATLVTVLTPANAPGAVNVTVQNPDSQTAVLTSGYTYVLPPPAATIKSAIKSGANLTLVWLGGTNASCPLLTATNVTQARATWTPVATNVVGADGLSTNSIAITPGEARRFYLLSVPYN